MFFILFLLAASSVCAEPIQITIKAISNKQANSHLVSDYLLKLLNQRSHGRIQVIPAAQSLNESSLERSIQLLQKGEFELIISDTSGINPLDLEQKGYELPGSSQESFFNDLSISHDALLRQLPTVLTDNFKLVGIWTKEVKYRVAAKKDSNMQIPLNQGESLDDILMRLDDFNNSEIILTRHSLSAYLVLIKHSLWETLPEDIRFIVNDAIRDATSYALELAQHDEQKNLKQLRNSYRGQITILNHSHRSVATVATRRGAAGTGAILNN